MEIMSPAGSFESLHTAIKAGANSIYFGVGKLNMRAQAAKNFTLEDLEKIINICQENNVRSYLTLNTVMYNEDLEEAKKICDKVKALGITSIIASDFSVIQYANSINLNVHISTQANVSNIEAVKFFSKFSDVIVLARELNLEQIKEICNQVQEEQIKGPSGELVKIEIFIHGALCVANSGKCYMSLGLYNTSANRGKCVQPCRRGYKITDEETGKELVLDNKYVMSPKDLCTIKFLDQILDSGVSVLKIEGRGRSPEYVYTVTKVYREAVDAYKEKTYTKEKIESWLEELKSVLQEFENQKRIVVDLSSLALALDCNGAGWLGRAECDDVARFVRLCLRLAMLNGSTNGRDKSVTKQLNFADMNDLDDLRLQATLQL